MPEEMEYQAAACVSRLLGLEPPEYQQAIADALEDDWHLDWAGAFGRAARKVYGMPPLLGEPAHD